MIDLVREQDRGPERAHYDSLYAAAAPSRPLTNLTQLAPGWVGPDAPLEMRRMLERLGELRDRVVVVLGNGESRAELYLLAGEPRALVYSDLSPVGLREIKRNLGPDQRDAVTFAAMDALDLPLRDASVDVVYGLAFVHHLPDVEAFLAEIARVLRPGGRCVFLDNAYSPAWQHVKLVWLRPLMRLSHRRHPRSPEDVHDTLRGGFREQRLAEAIHAVGGVPRFERFGFLYYFWRRASASLFPELFRFVPGRDAITAATVRADDLLTRFRWVRRNMIRLVWGFDKPS